MAGTADGSSSRDSVRSLAEKLVLAGVGAFARTGGRVEELAEELAERAGIRRDEAAELIDEAFLRVREESGRLGERTAGAAQRLAKEAGLASQDELDELKLRVAQLEHRLKLLEK